MWFKAYAQLSMSRYVFTMALFAGSQYASYMHMTTSDNTQQYTVILMRLNSQPF